MAELEKPKKLSLRHPVPRVSELNKKTIAVVVLIFLVVIGLIVSSLFNHTHTPATPTVSTGGNTETAAAVDATVTQLPASYRDASRIDQLLNRHAGASFSDKSAAQMAETLKQLKASQAALEAQLVALRQQSMPSSSINPMDQAASTSAIFFAGGAPTPLSQNMNTTASLKAGSNQTMPSQNTGSNSTLSAYQQQNMQAEKLDFLSGKPSKEIYNNNSVQYPVSPYILQAGTSIPAVLKTELQSTNPGYITAIVTQNVYDSINGQYLLIPKGSVLLGEYSSQVAYGQNSLQAKFTRLVRPDGSSIVLPNELGTDANGVSGFSDQVDNHWGQIIGSAALSAVFNIPAIVATNQQNNSTACSAYSNGVCVATSPSMGATLAASGLQSVGQTASQVGGQITERSLNLQPTIIIRAGYLFSVLVTKDIVLPPYSAE